MELLVALECEAEEFVTQTKNEDAGGAGVGPEKDDFAAGFENAVEFA